MKELRQSVDWGEHPQWQVNPMYFQFSGNGLMEPGCVNFLPNWFAAVHEVFTNCNPVCSLLMVWLITIL
jgi:hypothetical protein